MGAGFEGIEVGSQSNGESEHNPISFLQSLSAPRFAGRASRMNPYRRLDVETIARVFPLCQQESARYRGVVFMEPIIWG